MGIIKIKNNKSNVIKDLNTDCDIKLTNFPVSLVNSIRRTILSDIPNIVFEKIDIIKNNTNCHNEFLKHRFKLIPVFRNNKWKIKTFWNNELKLREYTFLDESIIPDFKLIFKSNKNSFNNYVDLYTNSIKITNESKELPIDNYFKKDLFTGDYIKLLVLKDIDTLVVNFIPGVSFANINSGFSAIGNVSYEYQKENKTVIDNIKLKKFDQINYERTKKNLDKYEINSIQHKQFNKSFELLDAERIYKRDENGECNEINMNIESIGVIQPLQAFLDACYVLKLKLEDILNYEFNENDFSLKSNNKFKFKFNLERNEMNIRMHNENHTLGNLINDYITKYKYKDVNIIKYNNYKLVHPLDEIIEYNINIENNDEFNDFLDKNDLKVDINNMKNRFTYVFIKTIKNILIDLDNIINMTIKNGDIKKPSFEMEQVFEQLEESDDEAYF